MPSPRSSEIPRPRPGDGGRPEPARKEGDPTPEEHPESGFRVTRGRARRRLTIAALLLPAFLMAFLAEPGVSRAEPVAFRQPGETAPAMVLRDLADREVAFPVPGRWNLVFFWSLFCHSCLEEMPVMVPELNALPGRPVESFFVSLDTARLKKGLTNFLAKRKLDCRLLLEEIASDSYRCADQWGVRTTPALFLVNPEGKIEFAREGPFPLDELFTRLRALPPTTAEPTEPATTTATPAVEPATMTATGLATRPAAELVTTATAPPAAGPSVPPSAPATATTSAPGPAGRPDTATTSASIVELATTTPSASATEAATLPASTTTTEPGHQSAPTLATTVAPPASGGVPVAPAGCPPEGTQP